MGDRGERRAAAIERGAEAVNRVTMPGHDWTCRDVAAAVLDASGLLDDEYEQVGWWRENSASYAAAWMPIEVEADQPRGYVPVFRKLSNTGEPK